MPDVAGVRTSGHTTASTKIDSRSVVSQALALLPEKIKDRYSEPDKRSLLVSEVELLSDGRPIVFYLSKVWYAIATDLAFTLKDAPPEVRRRFAALFVRGCRARFRGSLEDLGLENLYSEAVAYYSTHPREKTFEVFGSGLQPKLRWFRELLVGGHGYAQGLRMFRKGWPVELRAELLSLDRRTARSNAVEGRLMAYLPPQDLWSPDAQLFWYGGGIYTREFNQNAYLGPAAGMELTLSAWEYHFRMAHTAGYPVLLALREETAVKPSALQIESAVELVDVYPKNSRQRIGLVTRNVLASGNHPNIGLYYRQVF